jgi:hypothetical protein
VLPPGYYYPQAGLPVYQQPVYPQVAVAAPAPKVRMTAPDEPKRPARPAGLAIPSPEQLRLTPAASAKVDWSAIRGQLKQLQAACYQLDRVPAGGYRFTCWLPAAQAGKSYRIEAEGFSEAEAVRLCLERADRWARRSQ